MGGGLMQLVAYGAQDVYLTGNPQVTFFKAGYKRHTNFSMESIEQTFNGSVGFGRKVTCTISRNGDLISRIYLRAKLPAVNLDASGEKFQWVEHVGEALVKNVEIEIGGQKIDKHYGDWIHVWSELSMPADKRGAYDEMIGNVPRLVKEANYNTGDDYFCSTACGSEPLRTTAEAGATALRCVPETVLYVPFAFWFNRNPGLALPLIALQYHEVKVNLEFEEVSRLCRMVGVAAPQLTEASLFVDYIYLDTDERRKFAQYSHEYLIEQLQYPGDESVNSASPKIKLNFNHPVKELVWVVQKDVFTDCAAAEAKSLAPQPFNYGDDWKYGAESGLIPASNPVVRAKIQLNGHDRFSERDGRYFNFVQPWQHHTASPATGINVYSFALQPEEHQPSGTCNMSRIDTAILQLSLSARTLAKEGEGAYGGTARVKVWGVNYNILRVMSGMGGLNFNN